MEYAKYPKHFKFIHNFVGYYKCNDFTSVTDEYFRPPNILVKLLTIVTLTSLIFHVFLQSKFHIFINVPLSSSSSHDKFVVRMKRINFFNNKFLFSLSFVFDVSIFIVISQDILVVILLIRCKISISIVDLYVVGADCCWMVKFIFYFYYRTSGNVKIFGRRKIF